MSGVVEKKGRYTDATSGDDQSPNGLVLTGCEPCVLLDGVRLTVLKKMLAVEADFAGSNVFYI